MKVRELIDELATMEPEREVFVFCPDLDIEFKTISSVEQSSDYQGEKDPLPCVAVTFNK